MSSVLVMTRENKKYLGVFLRYVHKNETDGQSDDVTSAVRVIIRGSINKKNKAHGRKGKPGLNTGDVADIPPQWRL